MVYLTVLAFTLSLTNFIGLIVLLYMDPYPKDDTFEDLKRRSLEISEMGDDPYFNNRKNLN